MLLVLIVSWYVVLCVAETERIKKAGGMVSYITEDARLNGK